MLNALLQARKYPTIGEPRGHWPLRTRIRPSLGEPGADSPELCIKRLAQCSARAGGRRSIDKIIRSRTAYPAVHTST